MSKYEYRIVHLPGQPLDPINEAYLNGEGRLGWELVAAVAIEIRTRIGEVGMEAQKRKRRPGRIESRLEQICYMRRPLVELN